MTTSHLARLSFFHLMPRVFVFFDRTTDRLRWSLSIPRMPAVATMGGCRGRLCWTCSSERARKAEIEVLCRPRTDHFSRSLKGSKLTCAKSQSTMHEVKKLRSITDRWSSRSRATRLMPESQGFLPLPPVEDWRSKQDQVKLVHQQRRGASTLR